MQLNKTEKSWITKLEKLLATAPKGMTRRKISTYTIGDNNITLYDEDIYNEFIEANPRYGYHNAPFDVCQIVERSGAGMGVLYFPFNIESTAG